MRQVDDWVPVLVDLVEHIVPEQLENVSIACL
jgi:hypothetical protein